MLIKSESAHDGRAPHLRLPHMRGSGALREVVPSRSGAQPGGPTLRAMDGDRARPARYEAPTLAVAVPVLVPSRHHQARIRRRATPGREHLVRLRPEGQGAGDCGALLELRPAGASRRHVPEAEEDVNQDEALRHMRADRWTEIHLGVQPEQLTHTKSL